MLKRSSFWIRVMVFGAIGIAPLGNHPTVLAGKPSPKSADARMSFGDLLGDGITSDGLGEYVDGGRTVVGMNPYDGSINVNSGRDRAYCFDFTFSVSEDFESPFGQKLSECVTDARISIWSAGLNMPPGETKEVGIRVNFKSADGRDWWLHFNHPRWIWDGSPNDPIPPTVTAYDLDGSDDGISDTWITEATVDTTPAVLYELVKIRGQDTKIERGRFVMPFSLILMLER